MKLKTIRNIVFGLFASIVVFGLSSCSCRRDYKNGEVCGKATVDGNNVFSEVRRFYCEQWVYDYNLSLVETEGQPYVQYSDLYKNKYALNEAGTNLEVVEPGTDAYTSSHYIFYYYNDENISKVQSYISSTLTDSTKASEFEDLVKICAIGQKDGTETDRGYQTKVNSLALDEDDANKTVTSVSNRMTSHSKACLVFTEGFKDPQTGIQVPVTKWKQAWDVGLLYGLFVYPMGWLINVFVNLFGGTGIGQIAAIFVVTFILKILIFLITFRSQTSTQKMQDIQPELLAIQSKYGPNPTGENKQRMSMEMMAVYQKYGVKPLAPFASLLITFPVFIAMYRAVIYLGVLRTGSIAGVILGNNLSSYIIGENRFNWFALVIFIIMAASQIISMKLPQILNRKRMTPEAKKQQKQTSMMTNVMMIMILVMGFMMQVVMSIYWISSAVVAVLQSLIMHYINNSNKGGGRYKVKKEEKKATIPQGYKRY